MVLVQEVWGGFNHIDKKSNAPWTITMNRHREPQILHVRLPFSNYSSQLQLVAVVRSLPQRLIV